MTKDCGKKNEVDGMISAPKRTTRRENPRKSVTCAKSSVDPNSTTFLAVPPQPPTRLDYKRMLSFVSLYLVVVFIACVLIWVIQDPLKWKQRLLFCTSSILEALARVILASWWLKAAGPRLALVFVEIDVLSLSVVGFFTLVFPSLTGAMQYNLVDSSLTGAVIKTIVIGAAIKEAGKFLCYGIPLLLGQVSNASHLLFTAAIAGALGLLYTDMLTNDTEYDAAKFTMGLLYTMMYTLWTSIGCSILCHIKQNRISIWFSPFILIVPVIFHSCYLFAIAGWPFGWAWAGISAGYWLLSAVCLKVSLGPVLPMDLVFPPKKTQKDTACDGALNNCESVTTATPTAPEAAITMV
jgi:hypothetical protein